MVRSRKSSRAAASEPGRPVGADGAATRQRIMLTAMKHVAERGYARATLKDIAAEAGITAGTVFYYFPTKSELVTSAYVEIVEPVVPLLR